MSDAQIALQTLARRRWRMAIGLSVLMVVIYFGFILLIAFNKPAMGTLLAPGLKSGEIERQQFPVWDARLGRKNLVWGYRQRQAKSEPW